MRGYEQYNFPLFNRVADELRRLGTEVYNPAEKDLSDGFTPDQTWTIERHIKASRVNVEALLQTDIVVLLPGWERSRGACMEVEVARHLGLPVIVWPTFNEPSYLSLTLARETAASASSSYLLPLEEHWHA
jgi:hypothetical protein